MYFNSKENCPKNLNRNNHELSYFRGDDQWFWCDDEEVNEHRITREIIQINSRIDNPYLFLFHER